MTEPRSYATMLRAIATECRDSSGEAVRIAPDEFDGAAKMLSDLSGENAVLAGLLRDCDAVLATIETDDGEDAEGVRELRTALAYALDPYKREGTLL
jgi:hypothetical protein